MTPEAKFHQLEARAMASLSRPFDGCDRIAMDHVLVAVRIWQYPAFRPYQSWFLIQAHGVKGADWLVRRTTWDRSLDQARAIDPLKQLAFMVDPDPTPTVAALEARVPNDFATRVLTQLRELAVPSLLASESIGLDGVANGVETQTGRVHLEWWCDGPPEWRALTDGVEGLRLVLDEVVLSNPALQPPPPSRRG